MQSVTYDKIGVAQKKKKRKCEVLGPLNGKRARLMKSVDAEEEQENPNKKMTRGQRAKNSLKLYEELIKHKATETTPGVEPEEQGGSTQGTVALPLIQVPTGVTVDSDQVELTIMSVCV